MNDQELLKMAKDQSAMKQDIKYIRKSIDEIKGDIGKIAKLATKNRGMIIKITTIGSIAGAFMIPLIVEWVKNNLFA